MKISSRPPLIPPKGTAARLFVVGSTLGPIVDSFHNQCLLHYDFAPITLSLPPNTVQSIQSSPPIFSSSWAVPPLLGIAYIILGYILPRIIELLVGPEKVFDGKKHTKDDSVENESKTKDTTALRNQAILAVSSTALIIKLSEFLQTHDNIILNNQSFMLDANINLAIMTLADAVQWVTLDKTPVALIAATITAFGGPLSELPFVTNGFWHYIPGSADYLPLNNAMFQTGGVPDILASNLLGPGYKELALSSITGPCYFAVTMDAIALGRYFYSTKKCDE